MSLMNFPSLLNIQESPFYFMFAEMEKPTPYGLFHIISLILMAALILFIVLIRKRITEKSMKRVFICIWITVILLEAVKQINHAYSPESGVWEYCWRIFPFQFCSSIFYVLPFAIFFTKHKKIEEYAYSFLISYNLFAGLIVMFVPTTVFIENIAVNFQTMIHHASMVIVAALILATRSVKLNYKTILRGTAVFAILMSVALILNGAFHYKPGFNMFYVNLIKEPCELPVLGALSHLPLPIFLAIYIVGFAVCATLMLLIFGSIFRLITKNDVTSELK